ncbi:hypothetical protein [Ferrimonas marina]|uniref:Uncharacterized protein n=1 Tax=Ferrimonas marina TaxID=299255 RepID=A0A1M5YQ57_9GAMM|nr:hypothetical protein [Ferrimonas marina]SHI14227.1 hypothetical protein SAMN02745129_4293 [Ferrimonas marina]
MLLIIGVNLLQQHKEKLELARQQQLAKQKAIIDETEQLLSIGAALPMSPALLTVLNQRVLEATDAALTVDPKNKDFLRRKADVQAMLRTLKQQNGEPALDSFSVPNDEKQLVPLVQGLKRLKEVLRHEHNRSRVDNEQFTQEMQRADQLLVRINSHVLLERARFAMTASQLGSAKQLLSKLITNLNAQPSTDLAFRDAVLAQANTMLDEIDQRQQANLHQGKPTKAQDDLDELFQPKKKW